MMFLEVHHVSHASMVMASGKIPFALTALVAGALNIIFSIIFVHKIGLIGIALGTLLAQLLTNNWYAVYVNLNMLGVKLTNYLRYILVRLILIALPHVVGQGLMKIIFSKSSDILVLTAGLIVSFLIHFILLRLLKKNVSQL